MINIRLGEFSFHNMALSSPPTPPPPARSLSSSWQPHHLRVDQEASSKINIPASYEIPCKLDGVRQSSAMSRKRPAELVIPEYSGEFNFGERGKKVEKKEYFEVKGRDFFVANMKGVREVMEDQYTAMLDIEGNPKQAFFAVIDGHGGNAAADHVAQNLGNNILHQLQHVGDDTETALRQAYSTTDKQFLAKDENGGACAAGVLMKNGQLYTANLGDCKAVLSRNGKAISLTNDHRLTSRKDERARIENSGGFLYHHNGVCRVNGSLAVSRAFGDIHLKDWIISDPDIVKFPLTSDCHFLILASDGLWDKVSAQEAVDVVSTEGKSMECCRKLIDKSMSRGNIDDITVMVINLVNFKTNIAY